MTKYEEENDMHDEIYDLKLTKFKLWDKPVERQFISLAREMGISAKNAQKLVDFAEEHVVGNLVSKIEDARDKQHGEWAAAAEKAFGKNKDAILAKAARGLHKFAGAEEMGQDLRDAGLGNKKVWIEFFAELGGASSPGNGSKAAQGKANESAFLDNLYPTLKNGAKR